MGLDNKAYTYYRILKDINKIDKNRFDKYEIRNLMKEYSNTLMKHSRNKLILAERNYLDLITWDNMVEINMNGNTLFVNVDKFSNYNKTLKEAEIKYNPFKEFTSVYEPSESLEDRLKILEDKLIDDNLEFKKMNSTSRRYPELKSKIENDRTEYLALTKIRKMNNYNQQI